MPDTVNDTVKAGAWRTIGFPDGSVVNRITEVYFGVVRIICKVSLNSFLSNSKSHPRMIIR